MRTHAFISVALLALTACANAQHASENTSPAPAGSPAQLLSCETRELSLDGADLVITANVDQTVATITVVRFPDDEARAKAFNDARKLFGDPHLDTRTQTRQYRWGMVQLTDMCGRPVMPSPTPSPLSSGS